MHPARKLVQPVVTLAILCAILVVAAGCLYIPTPKGEPLEGKEVKDADLAFLQRGMTTKEDVIARFGAPTFFWRDENVLIYRWVVRHGVLLWAIGGHYNAAAGVTDIPQEKAFLLKFDGDDRYLNSQILEKSPLKSYGDFLIDWRDRQRSHDWKPEEQTP